jgi:ATP-dependent protease ClpP protease subunit
VFAGMRLYDYLSQYKSRGHQLTTQAMGIAMSMAAILEQAGDIRLMGKESIYMIHKGSLAIGGDFDEIKNVIKFIEEKQHERIIDIFVERAAKSGVKKPITAEVIRKNWEQNDWYLDSRDCLKYGLVDRLV